MYRQVKFYLMIHPERAPHYLGHNPLQQLPTRRSTSIGLVMVITGFTMYGQSNPGGLIRRRRYGSRSCSAECRSCGSCTTCSTWFFLIFVPIHIYLAIRADLLERGGTMSSIVSGGRFVPKDEEFIDG